MSKIEIRKYQEKDARELAAIYYNTIHRVNISDYTKEQVDVWAPSSSLELTGWKKKWEKLKPFVAVSNNQAIGFVELESNGHIDCFYCHHDWIGRGVGSALMDAVLVEAKRCKMLRLFAEVSITALPFFSRHEFNIIKEQTIVRNGVELNNFVMERFVDFEDTFDDMPLLLRKARLSDLGDIISLLHDDILGKHREVLTENGQYIDAMQNIIRDKNQLLIVIEHQNNIVATAHLTFMPSLTYSGRRRLNVEAVRVSKQYRGKLIGNWLFDKIKVLAKSFDCHMIQLCCNKERADAQRFYENLGFVSSHVGYKYHT